MDSEKRTKNHVSYVFSKEVLLKGLLEHGVLAENDYERYDLMLYDRYHIDAGLGIPRPTVNIESSQTDPMPKEVSAPVSEDYISLTVLLRFDLHSPYAACAYATFPDA